MTSARGRLALPVLGAAMLACTLLALSLHVPESVWVGTLPRKHGVIALMLASAALYGVGIRQVLRRPEAASLATILAVAVAIRLCLLAAPPFMSTDIYRYVWDGRVQAAGLNPYLYVATDPALAGLPHDEIFSRMNRVDYAHTIYPPAAQLLYAAVGRVSQTVTAMKAAMLLLEAAGVAALLALLRRARLPSARVLIYAWNPLAFWAVAGDGHIDAAAIGLTALALLAFAARRDAVAGTLLGGAILTKFLPLVVAPAIWRRWSFKAPLACIATIAALYALYLGAGWLVLGFLPNYTQEEGLAGGGFFALAALGRLMPIPHALGTLYLAAAVLIMAAIAWRIVAIPDPEANRHPVALARNAGTLIFATMILMSAHYPWYFAWAALPAVLWPKPWLLWLATAPLVLYWDPWHDEPAIQAIVFVPAMILLALDAIPPKLLMLRGKAT